MASRGSVHSQAAGEHRREAEEVATGLQRSALEEGVFPGGKGKGWGGGCGEGFRGAESRQCAQEEANGMHFFCVALFAWATLFFPMPTLKTTGSPWLLLANSVIQGYEVTHRDIELLKLRNFTIGTKIDDSVLSSDDAQVKIKETMRGLENFVCLSMLAATSSCHSTASIWKLTC